MKYVSILILCLFFFCTINPQDKSSLPDNSLNDDKDQTDLDTDDKSRIPLGKNPWKLKEDAEFNLMFPGIDYLVTYWMARCYGYLEDDAPDTCLRWKE